MNTKATLKGANYIKKHPDGMSTFLSSACLLDTEPRPSATPEEQPQPSLFQRQKGQVQDHCPLSNLRSSSPQVHACTPKVTQNFF